MTSLCNCDIGATWRVCTMLRTGIAWYRRLITRHLAITEYPSLGAGPEMLLWSGITIINDTDTELEIFHSSLIATLVTTSQIMEKV